MKTFLYIFILTISNIFILYSQSDSIEHYKNVVYVEILGNSILSGICFEREIYNGLFNKNDNLNLNVGLGTFVPSIGSSLNYSIGEKNQIEFGIGYHLILMELGDKYEKDFPILNFGYKSLGKNLIFKFYFMPIYNFIGFNFSIYRF
jgi:hypothetical protein